MSQARHRWSDPYAEKAVCKNCGLKRHVQAEGTLLMEWQYERDGDVSPRAGSCPTAAARFAKEKAALPILDVTSEEARAALPRRPPGKR